MARVNILSALGLFLGFLQIFVNASPASQAEQLSIGEIINLLGLGFVNQINTIISLQSLETNLVEFVGQALLSISCLQPNSLFLQSQL